MKIYKIEKKNENCTIEGIFLVLLLLAKFFLLYNDNKQNVYIIVYTGTILTLLFAYFVINNFCALSSYKFWLCLILTIIISLIVKNLNIFFLYLGALNFISKKGGIRQYIKWFGIGLSIGLTLSIFLSSFYVIQASFLPASRSGYYLYDFGLGHHNSPFMFYICIVLCFLLYSKSKILRLVLFIGALILFKYTYSRTGFLCVAIVFALEIVKVLKCKTIFMKYCFILTPLIFLGVSYIIALKLNTVFFNKLLSTRPMLFNLCINSFHITLFGNDFNSVRSLNDTSPIIVDNFFLNFLYGGGVIVFVAYICLYLIVFYFAYKVNNIYLKNILFAFMIYGIFEANITSFIMNFPVGILFIAFLSNKSILYSFLEIDNDNLIFINTFSKKNILIKT